MIECIKESHKLVRDVSYSLKLGFLDFGYPTYHVLFNDIVWVYHSNHLVGDDPHADWAGVPILEPRCSVVASGSKLI